MAEPLVIARAYGGEPLKRVATASRNGLVYLANPDALQAVNSGDSSPVGFPPYDVYDFDETAFSKLEMEWRNKKRTADKLWGNLKRFRYQEAAN